MHCLEIDSVILDFGSHRVLQSVYLKCEKGKVTALLGRNGSGKSCLMRILAGELRANDFSIRINEAHLPQGIPSSKELKYLPQHFFIPDHLTVKRVCKDFDLDFNDLKNLFPCFNSYFHTKVKHLSGGEKRILEIYAILVSRSTFCALDEPFSQVMPLHIEVIEHLIEREKKNKGILITDHLYQHVINLCDDLYVLRDGKTNYLSTVEDLSDYEYLSNLSKE